MDNTQKGEGKGKNENISLLIAMVLGAAVIIAAILFLK